MLDYIHILNLLLLLKDEHLLSRKYKMKILVNNMWVIIIL